MRIPILTFGAIASIIAINSVFGDTTVTSKTYVDTTRQATIPAAGTNASTPGTTVVTYTGTAGQIGERGIFNPRSDWDDENGEIVSGHEGDLLDAGSIFPGLAEMGDMVQSMGNDFRRHIHPIYNECIEYVANAEHTDANCLLWQLANQTDAPVQRCQTNADCGNPEGNHCGTLCVSGMCQQQNC